MLRTAWARKALCVVRSTRLLQSKSYSVLHESAFESVDVPCGASSPITIKIHNPPGSTPLPILLYITTSSPSLPHPQIPPPLLSPSHTTIHISPPWCSSHPFPQPLHKLHYAYTHILSRLRPSTHSSRPYPEIAIYGTSLGGTLGTTLALTECCPNSGPGRYPSALATTDSIFDFSPLAIDALHSPPPNKNKNLHIPSFFSSAASTLDPFASPLLFFRGPSYPTSDFPTSWSPSPPLLFSTPEDTSTTHPPDPTPQKRSYLKFPPSSSLLHLPHCAFQVSHAPPPPPPKAKTIKSTTQQHLDSTAQNPLHPPTSTPLQTSQALLLASALQRAIRIGHDTGSSLRGGDDNGEVEERGVVRVLGSQESGADMAEEGAMGARTWFSEVLGWR